MPGRCAWQVCLAGVPGGVPGRCRQHVCAEGVIFPADALGSHLNLTFNFPV